MWWATWLSFVTLGISTNDAQSETTWGDQQVKLKGQVILQQYCFSPVNIRLIETFPNIWVVRFAPAGNEQRQGHAGPQQE